MADSVLFGLPFEYTRYRAQTVTCPRKFAPATIMAASWITVDNHWRPWTVVDCSLMPAGCVFCDERCLEQLEFEALRQ